MSNSFGTGSAFGAASNQNRNQTTPTPGTAPAATGGLFGNLGANTTTSSVFGGAGTGNTPGGGGGTTSGTTGGIFGTGGGLFGSKNTSMTAPTPAAAGTSGPFNTSSFGGVYASYFWNHFIQIFLSKSFDHTRDHRGINSERIIPECSFKPRYFRDDSRTRSVWQCHRHKCRSRWRYAPTNYNSGFRKSNLLSISGSPFGFPKPAAPGSSTLGSTTGGPTSTGGSGTTGGNLFGGTMTATGGAGNPNPAGSPAPAATGTTASSNILSGGLFGNAKPADNVAKPATSNCEHYVIRKRDTILMGHSLQRSYNDRDRLIHRHDCDR